MYNRMKCKEECKNKERKIVECVFACEYYMIERVYAWESYEENDCIRIFGYVNEQEEENKIFNNDLLALLHDIFFINNNSLRILPSPPTLARCSLFYEGRSI